MMMLNIQTIKWVATGAIMVATVMRALNFHTGDIIIGLLGTVLWAYCAYKMKDKPTADRDWETPEPDPISLKAYPPNEEE